MTIKSTETQASDHQRVTNKYRHIYRFMSKSWDYSVLHYENQVRKDKLLDFLLFSWGKACRNQLEIDNNFLEWRNEHESGLSYVNQQGIKIKRADLFSWQSRTCLTFALNNQLWNPDVLVELGGGCGHNLIRASCGELSSILQKTYLLNAEFSQEGRELSDKLFKDFNIKRASSMEFNYYDSTLFFKRLKDNTIRKRVHLITVASVEQIRYLDFEFMKELKNLSKTCQNMLITFCEPITWQYSGLLNEKLAMENLRLSDKSKHNTNLWPIIQRSVRELDCKICKISPSLFRQSDNGLDLSGIQITF